MSLQMIMKLDGVDGDSNIYKYKGWSGILSWSWGMTSNRKTVNQNLEDKTSINEISVVKAMGNDSSCLRLLFAEGKTIPFVEFCMFPVIGKKEVQKNYINIRIEDVVIKSIVTGGGTDDNFFKEHITLLFKKIKFEYDRNTQVNEGTSVVPGKEMNFEWDIFTNMAWKH